MWKFFLGLTLAFFTAGSSIHAQAKSVLLSQHDALTALQQVAYAGQTLNFTGVFVIQKGDHFEEWFQLECISKKTQHKSR